MQLLFEGDHYSRVASVRRNICMEVSYLHTRRLYDSQCPHKILSAAGQVHDSDVCDHWINEQAMWPSQQL